MSRPDELPSWCDDDAASKVVEPSPTKKLAGFLYKERPAMQFWNWIQRNFVKWILHLDVSVNQFDPHAASTPDMTVIISAGKIQNEITHTSIAEQITSAFVAPAGNPRIDRIVIDNVTGVYSIITGVEDASPVAPDLTSGKIAICQVLLDDSPATTTITSDLITDERGSFYVRRGLVQTVDAVTGTSGGCTTTLPDDASLPLIAEGCQLFSLNITPKYSNSKLVFTFDGVFYADGTTTVVAALFDNNDVCVQARASVSVVAGQAHIIPFSYEINSPSTSALTYKVRFGRGSGGSEVWASQKGTGSPSLGNVNKTRLQVQEIL